MKILVIGNGFIAQSIIRKLEREKHNLLIFSRTPKVGILSKQVTGDIFNMAEFSEVLQWKPQVIVNTAWVTTHESYMEDPSNLDYANFAIRLASSLPASSVEHLIVLGSCAEYGFQSSVSTAGITKLNPINLYSTQKVFAFTSINEILKDSGVRFSWARVFQPYGPIQDKNRLIPYLITAIKSGQKIQLRDTTTIRDWISTRDIASAISWTINNLAPTELDIATSHGITNLELLRQLEKVIGISNQWEGLAQQVAAKKCMSVAGKNSPLFTLGWQPSDKIEQGLRWVLAN
jgi:nucleoside-diphosphate-sugar epimerase